MKTILYSKKVFKKGFDIKKEFLEDPSKGDYKAGTTQDDCKGKCNWQGFGVRGWHKCRKCRTEEKI